MSTADQDTRNREFSDSDNIKQTLVKLGLLVKDLVDAHRDTTIGIRPPEFHVFNQFGDPVPVNVRATQEALTHRARRAAASSRAGAASVDDPRRADSDVDDRDPMAQLGAALRAAVAHRRKTRTELDEANALVEKLSQELDISAQEVEAYERRLLDHVVAEGV